MQNLFGYIIFCLILIILVGFLCVPIEKYIFNNYTVPYLQTQYGIPFIRLYAFATFIIIVLYNILPFDNIFLKILITTFVIVVYECWMGCSRGGWNYYEWKYSKYMMPFCNGYNSIYTSLCIMVGVSILFLILAQAEKYF